MHTPEGRDSSKKKVFGEMEARSIIYIVLLTIFHPSYGAEWDYRDYFC